MPGKWPPPTYVVRVEFDAPRDFVYGWCTDYTPADAKLEGERYERRILSRSAREVVYEDLEEAPDGWHWARHVVTLDPPAGWHSDTVGSHREMSIDYQLRELPRNRTELTLTARRRRSGVGARNPSKKAWEKNVGQSWAKLRRSLERDHKKRGRGSR